MNDEKKSSAPKLKELKARAQLLKPCVSIGKAGLTDAVLAALDHSLSKHLLVKLKFDEFKDQKKTLAPEIALRTNSQLVQRVGNTAVFYRVRQTPETDSGE
ncbi:MAG: YhbY family RNA-binding protein [Chthoniobacterales bacterium]